MRASILQALTFFLLLAVPSFAIDPALVGSWRSSTPIEDSDTYLVLTVSDNQVYFQFASIDRSGLLVPEAGEVSGHPIDSGDGALAVQFPGRTVVQVEPAADTNNLTFSGMTLLYREKLVSAPETFTRISQPQRATNASTARTPLMAMAAALPVSMGVSWYNFPAQEASSFINLGGAIEASYVVTQPLMWGTAAIVSGGIVFILQKLTGHRIKPVTALAIGSAASLVASPCAQAVLMAVTWSAGGPLYR